MQFLNNKPLSEIIVDTQPNSTQFTVGTQMNFTQSTPEMICLFRIVTEISSIVPAYDVIQHGTAQY